MPNSLKQWQGIACVIGVDWGDSGKGRLVDDLAQNAHIVARFNGGSNTGHTVQNEFGKFALHIIPSGIFNPKTTNVIGRGVAVDLESLIDDEIGQLKKAKVPWKNLVIEEQATLVMPWHKKRDGLREELRGKKIGTTKRGVGPAYADRAERVGLQVKDLLSTKFKQLLKDEIDIQNKFYKLNLSFEEIAKQFQKYTKIIKPLIGQTIPLVKKAHQAGKNILFEAAQGYFLDVDAGTYPFVTSSNTGVLGIFRSYDIHPSEINHVVGITKAYMTRVGNGPMPTKMEGQVRNSIIERGHEIGTTSGRVRDPGWLDLVLIKAACHSNKINHLVVTKLDVLSGLKKVQICTQYKKGTQTVEYLSGNADYLAECKPVYEELNGWEEDLSDIREFNKLPQPAKRYIRKIEDFTKVPVNFIGVGPERSQVIYA